MTFFTQVTANPNATQETLERQHVAWNKGLTDYLSAEARAKRSESLKDYYATHQKPPNRKGAILSEETRAKLSALNKGKIVSEETRAKLSAHNKGKKHSAETCAKRSASLSTPVMTPHGLFPSVRAVVRASGIYDKKVRSWFKLYPEHYYYVAKGE